MASCSPRGRSPSIPVTMKWSPAASRSRRSGSSITSARCSSRRDRTRPVLKTTVFLADMADFAAMNEVYAKHFGTHRPARSTVAVGGLPAGLGWRSMRCSQRLSTLRCCMRGCIGPGGLAGLQNRDGGASGVFGGFDSHTLPPLRTHGRRGSKGADGALCVALFVFASVRPVRPRSTPRCLRRRAGEPDGRVFPFPRHPRLGAGQARPATHRGDLHRLRGDPARHGGQGGPRARLHKARGTPPRRSTTSGRNGRTGSPSSCSTISLPRSTPSWAATSTISRRREDSAPRLRSTGHSSPCRSACHEPVAGRDLRFRARRAHGRGAILHRLPHDSTIYFGDTARVPYGPKSPETVRRYSREILDWLVSQGVKAVVIACNTSTAHALDSLREVSRSR